MVLEREAKIRLAYVAGDLKGFVSRESANEIEGLLRTKGRSLSTDQSSIHAIDRRLADTEVQIRCAAMDRQREDIRHLIAILADRQVAGGLQRLPGLLGGWRQGD